MASSGRYKISGALPSTAIERYQATAAIDQRPQPRLLAVGDMGLSVQFGTEIDPATNDAVAALDHAITVADLQGVIETVPSFRSLLVIYEPALVDRETLLTSLRKLARRASRVHRPPARHWRIPVAYDPPFGEDLAEVSALLGLSEQRVIAAHTMAEFRVYMLGFQPGLPNLGGLPPELHISRRLAPRAPVPGGSVVIGGVQGAIMPMPTPTGLYCVGRTPIRLFDRIRAEPALLQSGDVLHFRQIGADEFSAIDAAVLAGDSYAGAELVTEAA